MNKNKNIQKHILVQFKIVKELGNGAYGYVWQVIQRSTNKRYALKKVYEAFRNRTDSQRTFRQIQILEKLSHENIIKLYRVIRAQNGLDLYLIMEYMPIDLLSLIKVKGLEKKHKIYICFQILKGLSYLHSGNVMHRDLKPANLLLNAECCLKICDFGLARTFQDSKQNKVMQTMTEEIATKWYRAPEILLGSHEYGVQADIWSFGCIVAEMITGKPLFQSDSVLSQFQKMLNFSGISLNQDIKALKVSIADALLPGINLKVCEPHYFVNKIDAQFLQLISRTLVINPQKRISAYEALKLSIFSEYQKQHIPLLFNIIQLPVSDNVKLSIQKYQSLIYSKIQQKYLSEEKRGQTNILKMSDNINSYLSQNKKRKHRALSYSIQKFNRIKSHSKKKQYQIKQNNENKRITNNSTTFFPTRSFSQYVFKNKQNAFHNKKIEQKQVNITNKYRKYRVTSKLKQNNFQKVGSFYVTKNQSSDKIKLNKSKKL